MFSELIYIEWISISFFLRLNNIPLYGHTIIFIHLWTFGLFLPTVNSGTMDMHVHVFVGVPVFYYFGCISKNRIAELCGTSMFNFLRNFQHIFHSDWTNFHSTSNIQWFQFPHIFANTCYFSFFVFLFFTIAILLGMKWHLIVVLIWIFLIIHNVENLFMWLLSSCIFSLEKLLSLLPIFNNWVVYVVKS